MGEKVTLRFENSDNNDIIQSEPFSVVYTVNNVSDLYGQEAINILSKIEEKEGVIFFVKNVGAIKNVDIPSVGAYYRFHVNESIPNLGGEWEQVLIGTHSHENKNFLDDIGRNLPSDTEKEYNVVAKFNEDKNNFEINYEEKVDAIPLEKIPELPGLNSYRSKSDDTFFLSTNSDGGLKWEQIIMPSNSFSFQEKKVDEEAASLTFKTGYTKETDILILFLNGIMVPGVVITDYKEDPLSLTVQLPMEDGVFEKFHVNDTVSILILRNAVSSSNCSNQQYFYSNYINNTKNSTNAINSSEYITRDMLNSILLRYSLIKHDHNLSYAPFQHTHTLKDFDISLPEKVSDELLQKIIDKINATENISQYLVNTTDVYTRDQTYSKIEVDNRIDSVKKVFTIVGFIEDDSEEKINQVDPNPLVGDIIVIIPADNKYGDVRAIIFDGKIWKDFSKFLSTSDNSLSDLITKDNIQTFLQENYYIDAGDISTYA